MPNPLIWPIPTVGDTFATVGLVSAAVRAANPKRVDCDLTNTSGLEGTDPYWIYLARGNDAVVGAGIPLSPKGGTYHLGVNNLFLGVINAISTNETVNLAISEGEKPG